MNSIISFFILYILITFNACKTEVKKPQPPVEEEITFIYKPETQPQTVYLAGEFNAWKVNDPNYQMIFKEGAYIVKVKKSLFKKGNNAYVFVVNGDWLPDPNASLSENRGIGGKVSIMVIR